MRGPSTRRLVRRVDIWTVFKVSAVFYLCMFFVLLVAGVILWNVAAAFGVISTFEKLIRSLFVLKTFVVHPGTALVWGAVIGGVACVFGTLVNVLVAFSYNLVSDVIGGLQIVVVTEEDA